MSAGNAFATLHNTVTGDVQRKEKQDQTPRPTKRACMSKRAAADNVWRPCAQEETQLEVDVMILDYITFQATRSCFQSRRTDHSAAEDATGTLRRSLELAGSFTSTFKARHTRYQPDAELRLRLLLLRMTTLFTQRLTSNPTTPQRDGLQALRRAHRERAKAWIEGLPDRMLSAGHDNSLGTVEPVKLAHLERNRAHVLDQLGVPAEDEDYEDAFYGTASSVSLLDLLPLFVELSAASSNIHGSSLTQRWMHLGCEFMLQACLEQYLVYGAQGTDVLDEAFAWGYSEGEGDARETTNGKGARDTEINDMFEDDTYAIEIDGWDALKRSYLGELVPGSGQTNKSNEPNTAPHFESVAAKHPMLAFEASLLKFLEALSSSIAEPVLVQLERGKLDGMTEKGTQEFLVNCGVTLI